MITNLSILNSSGDTEISWDTNNPKEVSEARIAVASLKALGYSFFLSDGLTPADEVQAGQGMLKVRRVNAEELLAQEPETPQEPPPEPAAEPEKPAKGKRGRKPGRKALAVPPMAGG